MSGKKCLFPNSPLQIPQFSLFTLTLGGGFSEESQQLLTLNLPCAKSMCPLS